MRPWNVASLTLPAFILHGCGDGSSTASTTVAEATTTTSSAEFGQCFPDSSIDYSNSNYLCYPASYCSEQDSAIKLGPMTLAECMRECEKQSYCLEIQFDCNTDCWVFNHHSCGSVTPSFCGSSIYYRSSTLVTMSTSTTTSPTFASTTELGTCWPNEASLSDFRCTGSMYCTSQHEGTNYGEMSLRACARICRETPWCQHIQYDCHKDCILLEDCSRMRPTVCGSSIYHYDTTASIEVSTASEEGNDFNGVVLALLIISGIVVMGGVVWKFQMCRRRQLKASAGLMAADRVIMGRLRTTRFDNEDDLQPLTYLAAQNLPAYWSTAAELPEVSIEIASERRTSLARNLAFDELAYVKHEHLRSFQNLVNHTYQPIPTQDRLCPTEQHGKTRGGCPCVQPGGSPGLPTGFQVKRVIRVEDSDMFNRYITRREKIKTSRGGKCQAPEPAILTREAIQQFSGLQGVVAELDPQLNEVYLWHGTQVRIGLQIAQEDFSLTFAGSGAGTMYGKGLYFSESSTKADEYSKDEPSGYYDGVRALLLCRVCMGEFYYTADREPGAMEKFLQGISDSTLGDRAKAVKTYREFVVYDKDQVYPEYLVLYERLHGERPPEPPPKDMPFLLELPLYWKNVGRNPKIQDFHDHWLVRPKITSMIYRLALHTSENTCPKVQRAKRVEDSVLWCKYMNWKKQLAQQLRSRKMERCTPPNELDGNPSSGHVLTGEILAEHDGDEAISLENMVAGLNELLLWHGTSREAAKAIASDGFILNAATHGRRFGKGVYLAEDLRKSLSYCKESDGVKYVLLCRAVCGEMYYTEKEVHRDAPEQAVQEGKQSVLANPQQVGPREYILFDTAQVYPEYIVEFVTKDTE